MPILEQNTKTIHLWGNGRCVMVTRESKALGWKIKQKVLVTAVKEKNEDYIKITKLG